jgi:hypothetical protein
LKKLTSFLGAATSGCTSKKSNNVPLLKEALESVKSNSSIYQIVAQTK